MHRTQLSPDGDASEHPGLPGGSRVRGPLAHAQYRSTTPGGGGGKGRFPASHSQAAAFPAVRGAAEVRRKPQREGPGRSHTSRGPQRSSGRWAPRWTWPQTAADGSASGNATRPAPTHAPPPAARLGQSRAPRAEADGTDLRHCGSARPLRPLPAPGGPWELRSRAHARGAFHTRWEQGRRRTPRPSRASASEFPPGAGAASKVRARPLFSGVGGLTFRGLRWGNSPFLPDLFIKNTFI